jgi:hypothetical protein
MKLRLGLCGLFIALIASIAFGGDQFMGILLKPLFTTHSEIPEYVLYESIFRLESRNQSKDNIQLESHFKNTFELNSEQDEKLRQTAIEFTEAIRPIDALARVITDELRKQFPSEKSPIVDVELLQPPVELAELQAQRNAIVLEYRDKLQAAFGAAKFQAVDEKVKTDFASNFRKLDGPRVVRGQK